MRQAAEIKNERASPPGSQWPEVSGTIPRFRLDRRQPTSDQIYQHLRNAILTWQVLPNEPISENRISALCGVSRSPVRAALARLVEDGLIEVFPQRGTFVSPIRLKAVREAQFVRAALELAVVVPVIGWFVVLPLGTVAMLGAATFALLRWQPRAMVPAPLAWPTGQGYGVPRYDAPTPVMPVRVPETGGYHAPHAS